MLYYIISVLWVYIRFSAFNSQAIQLLYNIIDIYKDDYLPTLVIRRLNPILSKITE